jgi:hypothetical protein
MTNHPNRSKARKLPGDVYYTARNGGMYVRWNGRPEGGVSITHSKAVAYGLVDENGLDDDGFRWQRTPYQGADGSCRRAEVIRLAAEYSR